MKYPVAVYAAPLLAFEKAKIEEAAAAAEAAAAPADAAAAGAEDSAVIVKTVPPQGEVLLINAFAFKVCTRKKPDPWDRFACKWTEIETGVEKQLSGRYVYQAKWPDGVVRKGTRDIVPNYDDDTAATVTFKKVGS